MSTGSATASPELRLSDVEKGWLANVVGGEHLFSPQTGLVVKGSDGNDIDFAALKQEVENAIANPDSLTVEELEEKQAQLARLGYPSVSDKSEEFSAKQESKEKALKSLRNLLDLQRNEIRSATDYNVKVKKRVEIGGKEILYGSKQVKSKHRKIEKAYDSAHYENRVLEGPSPEQKKAIDLVVEQLLLLTEQLKNNEDYEFSPQEIMNELWTPLVREKLISEEECPVEFSRITQLFKGASSLYNKRLEEVARREVDEFADVRDCLSDISKVLGVGAAVADVVLSVVGTGAEAQKIVKLATKCAQSTLKSTSAVLQKQADFKTAGDEIGGIIGSVLEATIGGDNGESIGKIAQGAFKGCVNLSLFAKKMVNREYESGLDLLAEAIGDTISCIAVGVDSDVLGKIGDLTTSSLQGAFTTGKLIYLLNQEPVNMAEVKSAIIALTKNAIKVSVRSGLTNGVYDKEAAGLQSEIDKEEEGSDKFNELTEKLKELEKSQEEALGELDGIFDSCFDSTGELLPKIAQKVERKALELGAEAAEQELAEGRDQFGKQLAAAFNMTVAATDDDQTLLNDMYSIDALIAQIEQDRAAIEMFNVIFDAVGGVLTTFVPQLGGPLKAKAFAMNLVAAVERSMDLNVFLDLLSDARKAATPQAATLLSEVDELKRHLTNDVADTIITFGQMVSLYTASIGDAAAGAMGTGAVAGVVGRATNAGLEAFKQAKDILAEKFADKKTVKAWEMYKRALSKPQDRRHILKTFQANPTLAKYGIAYGAIEMGDPIAKETLRRVGLNDMVLSQADNSADKVVLFLEARFADDIKVEGVLSRFAPDLGDPLTLSIWIKNKETAASEKNPADEQWKTENTNAIDAALKDLEKAAAAAAKHDISKVDDPKNWEVAFGFCKDHKAKLEGLKVALSTFKPVTVSGVPFKRFESYAKELMAVATEHIEDLDATIAVQARILNAQRRAIGNVVERGKKCLTILDGAVGEMDKYNALQISQLLDQVLVENYLPGVLQSLETETSGNAGLQSELVTLKHVLNGETRKIKKVAPDAEQTVQTKAVTDCLSALKNSLGQCKTGIETIVVSAERDFTSTAEVLTVAP